VNEVRSVVISEGDYARISSCLEGVKSEAAELLREELDNANIVVDDKLPENVVNMGAEVSFRDLESGALSYCSLVFPHQADSSLQRVSVLAPVGAALIGLPEGGTIAWPVPGRKIRRLEVINVVQQQRFVDSA